LKPAKKHRHSVLQQKPGAVFRGISVQRNPFHGQAIGIAIQKIYEIEINGEFAMTGPNGIIDPQ
jgi:hypothetical protein